MIHLMKYVLDTFLVFFITLTVENKVEFTVPKSLWKGLVG